jgi:hypothetical protein
MQQTVGANGDAKGVNMWLGVADSSSPFNTYNQNLAGSITSNLDIYSATPSAATKLMTLNFNTGVVSAVAAVPEPTTYALIGLGAVALLFAYRRKISA